MEKQREQILEHELTTRMMKEDLEFRVQGWVGFWFRV